VLTRKEREARLEKQLADNFKNHVANYCQYQHEGKWPIEVLDWRDKKGGSINSVRYIMMQGILYVSGDWGEAIHGWSWSPTDQWSMKNVAGCDLGYYMSKCLASSEGERGKVWDEAEARDGLVDIFADDIADNSLLKGDKLRQAAEELYEQQCEKRGRPNMYSRDEFHQWAHAYAAEFFNNQYWMERVGDVGLVISMRHKFHLMGLKSAMAQVSALTSVARPWSPWLPDQWLTPLWSR
jgi:hypothetical protein